MSVTGYLALYTTLFGWQQYNNLWEIVVGTGLIYLPFIAIILSSVIPSFLGKESAQAAHTALRRLFVAILSAFLVIAFAAVPMIPLDAKVLHFDPLCTANTDPAIPGHTGTTYDNAFSVPLGVKVPILWYLVMAVANGVTHAANSGLSCSPINYRQLHSELNLAHIQDPQLKSEVNQFYRSCYEPAYTNYLSGNLNETQQDAIAAAIKKYGNQDTTWLGSNIFLNVPGFYDNQKANAPVKGFPYNPSRDFEEGQKGSPQWGEPDCKTWWQDSNQGLRKRLVNALPPSFLQALIHLGSNSQSMQDTAVKGLITHSFPTGISDFYRGFESYNDNNTQSDYISRFLGGTVGTLWHGLSFFPELHLLENALPVIQAILLCAIYAFLGLAIVFSSFRISFCVSGSVFLFSVIFCSYIWHLVQWLDNSLIPALFPSSDMILGLQEVLSTGSGNINGMFINMIIAGAYIVLPLFWMGMMTWASFNVGNTISGFLNPMSAPAKAAGAKAGTAGTQVGTSAML